MLRPAMPGGLNEGPVLAVSDRAPSANPALRKHGGVLVRIMLHISKNILYTNDPNCVLVKIMLHISALNFYNEWPELTNGTNESTEKRSF
jgi:hypothetical protein